MFTVSHMLHLEANTERCSLVLKIFVKLTLSQYVAEIYKDRFTAFSLQGQVRFLPEFIKGSNLSSLYN